MKRLVKTRLMGLIGPIGLISLIGCASEQTEGGQDMARPIAFSTYAMQPVTRADSSMMATDGIPGGASIGVYAYYHDGPATWSDAALPNFMFNQQATNQGLDQPFSYSPLKYWPNEESDKLSFIAYYPYVASGTAHGITPQLTNADAGLPTFLFQVNSNVKSQVDFMVSDLLPNLPESRALDDAPGTPFNNLTITDRVRFMFRHATSKIEFRITVDDDVRQDLAYFTLNSLALTNICNEGLLTPTYTAGSGSAAGTTTLSWVTTWSGHTTASTTDYSCKTTEAYLLLPQQLSDAAQLTISYDLAFKSDGTTYTYDAAGNLIPTSQYVYPNRTASIQLNTLKPAGSSTALDEWLPNHHYVYTIHLGAHRIEFTGQVAEWGEQVAIDGIKVDQMIE